MLPDEQKLFNKSMMQNSDIKKKYQALDILFGKKASLLPTGFNGKSLANTFNQIFVSKVDNLVEGIPATSVLFNHPAQKLQLDVLPSVSDLELSKAFDDVTYTSCPLQALPTKLLKSKNQFSSRYYFTYSTFLLLLVLIRNV